MMYMCVCVYCKDDRLVWVVKMVNEGDASVAEVERTANRKCEEHYLCVGNSLLPLAFP